MASGKRVTSVQDLVDEINKSSVTIERLESSGHPCPDAKRQLDKLLEELAAIKARYRGSRRLD
jgi:hypothetical protein